ncbi:TetR/AcrR family transcriptional regulator [Mycobacterium sp. UM_Kg1]|uniref:TetR/AcrR family transcriptional regulator n=1 Tax=Mycobacterium sp. UM_Kg1 TaxID=1545691 RepID=UPI000A65526E|nr:TetR/AcrR family transcriptional regulator [Mycobacterium sp. UM_Kg1]
MRKLTLTERRGEELRMSIALATRDIFLADGDTSATVERICDAAGVAPRTFHRHFPVKEDVVMPLLRSFGDLSVEVLRNAPASSNSIATLVEAFCTEVPRRGHVEVDRQFLALIISDPQYRLRWLDWGEGLVQPISEFLSARYDLGDDPFIRELPAHLMVQICRQAYLYWVASGDFAELERAVRAGATMVVATLSPR